MTVSIKSCLLVLLLLLTAACSGIKNNSNDISLYQALGAKPGINQLVEEFLWVVSEDERVVERFLKSDISRFQKNFSLQLCELSGGPCRYTGDSMQRVHGGHEISEMEFNAVVEDLLTAMERLNYSVSVQNRLLKQLAPMQSMIVGQ
jgi:hemoglobin